MSSASNAIFQRIQFQHLALNNLIQWGDHYSVDHPEIDAQHKAILELGTRVYENWRAGASVNVLRAAVDKLARLLEAHFAYEERLLAEIGYKELEQHAAEHRSMLKEIREMQDYFQTLHDEKGEAGGSVLAPGWSVVQFVLGFSVGHVSTSDMSYYQALIDSRKSA
jgi:hemerythrin-like metal-binding protein